MRLSKNRKKNMKRRLMKNAEGGVEILQCMCCTSFNKLKDNFICSNSNKHIICSKCYNKLSKENNGKVRCTQCNILMGTVITTTTCNDDFGRSQNVDKFYPTKKYCEVERFVKKCLKSSTQN